MPNPLSGGDAVLELQGRAGTLAFLAAALLGTADVARELDDDDLSRAIAAAAARALALRIRVNAALHEAGGR